jgi:hypothetical protein
MSRQLDFNTAPDELLLTPEETADALNALASLLVTTDTLQHWRYRRIGPRYLKLGRAVRYRLGDLREWINEQVIEPNAAAN